MLADYRGTQGKPALWQNGWVLKVHGQLDHEWQESKTQQEDGSHATTEAK